MSCAQCGNELEQHARFCSRCGHEVGVHEAGAVIMNQTPRPAPAKAEHDMNMHISILGWLLIASGILTAIGGLIVLFVSVILGNLPVPIRSDIPAGIPHFASWLTSVIGLGVLALAAATAAAGIGLLQYRSWARVFAVIMAAMLLFNFPIGTIVAIYAFWVLFSEEGQRYYRSRAESTMTPNGA